MVSLVAVMLGSHHPTLRYALILAGLALVALLLLRSPTALFDPELPSPDASPASSPAPWLWLQLGIAALWVGLRPGSARPWGAQFFWCALIVGLWAKMHPRSFAPAGDPSWLYVLGCAGLLWAWNRMWARASKESSPHTVGSDSPPQDGWQALSGSLLVLVFWTTYGILGGWLLTLVFPRSPGAESQAALIGISATLVVHVSRRLLDTPLWPLDPQYGKASKSEPLG